MKITSITPEVVFVSAVAPHYRLTYNGAPDIIGYTPVSPGINFDVSGNLLPPLEASSLYYLRRYNDTTGATADIFDEVEVSTIANTSGTMYKAYLARRGAHLTRLEISHDSGATWHSMLRRVDSGQSLGKTTRYRINPGGVNYEYNATFGGAINPDFSFSGPPASALYASLPRTFFYETSGATLTFSSSVTPFHFGDEYAGAESTWVVGGHKHTPGLMPRVEQRQKVIINYEGVANLIYTDIEETFPITVPETDFAAVITNSFWVPNYYVTGTYLQKALNATKYYDFQSYWVTSTGNADAEITKNYVRMRPPAFADPVPEGVVSGVNYDTLTGDMLPVHNDIYAAVVEHNNTTGTHVCFLTRMVSAWDGQNATEFGLTQMRSVAAQAIEANAIADGILPDYDRNIGQRLSFRARGTTREAGDISLKGFFFLASSLADIDDFLMDETRIGIVSAALFTAENPAIPSEPSEPSVETSSSIRNLSNQGFDIYIRNLATGLNTPYWLAAGETVTILTSQITPQITGMEQTGIIRITTVS